MANVINNLESSKFFGISISADRINRNKICMPQEALKQRKKKMDEYKTIIKKNRHASPKDKVKNAINKGALSKGEGERRESLKNAFIETKKWMEDFHDFFWVCVGNNVTKNYIKEIDKDFKELKKKGYVEEIPEKDFKRLSADNKKEFCLDIKYENKRYPSQITSAYQDLYDKLYNSLSQQDEKFKTLKRDAEDHNKIVSKKFDNVSKYASEVYSKYTETYKKLNEIIETYNIRHNPILKAKKEKLVSEYNKDVKGLHQRVKSLARHRSNATFTGMVAYSLSTSAQTALDAYDDDLNKFCEDVTNTGYHISTLREDYEATQRSHTRLNNELDKLVNQVSGSSETDDEIASRINASLDRVEKIYQNICAAYSDFNDHVTKFDGEYEAWKKEQKARRIKVSIYAVLAVFGVLCTIVKAFFPLIDAAISPVDPNTVIEPYKPQS
ncbi:MAG: hypothetical protein Q4D57_05055 [Clostridia bacterium]|nr:hypothetical protein [Clostridia bacterium]